MAWNEIASMTADVVEVDENILNEIRVAVMGIATARGVAADLRVTVLNPTSSAVTISSGTVTVTGTLSRTTYDVQYQANLTAQGFTQNVTRS